MGWALLAARQRFSFLEARTDSAMSYEAMPLIVSPKEPSRKPNWARQSTTLLGLLREPGVLPLFLVLSLLLASLS